MDLKASGSVTPAVSNGFPCEVGEDGEDAGGEAAAEVLETAGEDGDGLVDSPLPDWGAHPEAAAIIPAVSIILARFFMDFLLPGPDRLPCRSV
jgi:hypothetical protein